MKERINKLTDDKYKIRFRIFTSRLNIGIILLAFSFIILNGIASSNGLTAAKHNIADCSRIKPNFSQQQCKMLLIK